VFHNNPTIQVSDDGMLTVKPAFFKFQATDLAEGLQHLTFDVVRNSDPSVFSQMPTIAPDGTVSFKIVEYALGSAQLDVKLRVGGPGAFYLQFESAVRTVEIVVNSIARTPRFSAQTMVSAPEDGGRLTRLLAYDVQAGHPEASLYEIVFTVKFDSPHLFSVPPTVSPDGYVHFTGAPGQHGSSKLTIEMFEASAPPGTPGSGPRTSVLKIFPLPRISSVLPVFGPIGGGSEVTIKGLYFGSTYSRALSSPAYGGFKVHVGGKPCIAEKFVSDSEVLCLTPQGVGLSTVTLSINDVPDAVRTGALQKSFSYVEVYYGGILPDGVATGFMAMGPAVTDSFEDADADAATADAATADGASYQSLSADIFGSVLSIVSFGGIPCFGGSFKKIGETRISHVACWDGLSPKPVGYGVDGSVVVMASFANMLIVGGTFSNAYQSEGGGFVQTGNLAAWNGSYWSVLGGEKFDGAVSSLTVNGSSIFVGGRFRKVGLLQVDGLAVFDGQQWSAVGGGVKGGSVHSIAVNSEFLFIGGSFRRAGNLSVSGLARWDSKEWRALGHLNGDVQGVAVLGPDLFVAGEFTEVDGMHVDYIARYSSGAWQKLAGGGVNGHVSSLAVANNCVYFSGGFTALRNAGEESHAAQHAGRYCPQPRVQGQMLQGMLTNTTSGPIRSVAASSDLDVATREDRALSWMLAMQQQEGH